MPNLESMLREQIAANGIDDEAILNAFILFPRELFVAEELVQKAYDDCPLPIGYGQTISQPFIVAFMLKMLDVKPEHKVLEIGAGSGYQAALLSALAQHVTAIELIPELYNIAKERLQQLNITNATIINGDGYLGWEENAPYDRIIVAAAAPFVPNALLSQLSPNGKMIIPVGKHMQTQMLKIIEKDQDQNISSKDSLSVRFVPLVRKSEF